jgi:hypothetical protein
MLQRYYTSYYPFSRIPGPSSPIPEGKFCTIWCLIDGESMPFTIIANVDDNMDELGMAIRFEKPTLREVGTSDLVLWKVSMF